MATAATSSKRPFVLAGTGRSGTSWLLDLLTSEPDYRPVFEPLHWYNVPEAVAFYDLYLRDEDENADLEVFFQQVFQGRPRDGWLRWMTYRTARNESTLRLLARTIKHHDWFKPFATQRVVKIIKGNLMLPWLVRRFSPRLVFLIRHPCAVVSSQLKMGWNVDVARLSGQETLVDDHLAPHMDTIAGAASPLEKLAVRWSIENLVPLRQAAAGALPACIFYFEDLVRAPEETLTGILSNFGLEDAEIARFVGKMKDKLPPHEATLVSWTKKLSEADRRTILGITRAFGIEQYGEEPFPIRR